MEIWTVHYTVEQHDSSTDLEIDIDVPNIDFVLPVFRSKVRLYRKITSIVRKRKHKSNL